MDTILGFLQNFGPFLLVIGVLIFVHELGHFLVARWYGVKVLAFSLGFGPKLLKVTRGDTEYCISAIPLGGYVKLAGETVEDTPSGDPSEFLSKSKWVRFQVYLAGPVMNIALALILTSVVLSQGADEPLYRSTPPTIGAVAADGAGAKAGLQAGDRVVRVNGKAVETWDDFDLAVMPKANRELSLTVERSGTMVDLSVTPSAEGDFEIGSLGVLPVLRPQVMLVTPGTPAEQGGLRSGDVFVAFNGERNLSREGLIAKIQKHPDVAVTFTVERAGQELPLQITPARNGEIGQIGAQIAGFETRRVDPDALQAVRMSFVQTWENSKLIGQTLGGLFTRETPVNQLMGPVAIAQMSGATAQLGWLPLLSLMAMISLNLGLLNLAPIPVLDGGHMLILALEGLARRDFSARLKERVLMAGAAAIMLLMATVLFNDFARLFR
jgi:regulator of sigma E protease